MQVVDNREPLPAPGTEDPYTIRFSTEDPPTPAHASHLIKLLVQQMPVENMADSHHGLRVLEMVQDVEDPPERLEFEDADHAWLVRKVDAVSPKIFGLMAQRFRDALEPMSVAEKKAARNGKKADPVPAEEAAPTEA